MKGLTSILPGASEPDATDDVCAMCPSLTYQQVRPSLALCLDGKRRRVPSVAAPPRSAARVCGVDALPAAAGSVLSVGSLTLVSPCPSPPPQRLIGFVGCFCLGYLLSFIVRPRLLASPLPACMHG